MKFPTTLPILFVLLVSGCATGPKYTEIQPSLSAIDSGNGRIYFYRARSMFGAGIQPEVSLNGEVVGDSKPGGFFFFDREPGDYEVVLATEVKRKLTFQLDAGEEKYVRMTVRPGVIVHRVYPDLIDQRRALKEIQGLSYTGSTTKDGKH